MGFALIVTFSALILLRLKSIEAVTVAFLITALSTLPDIDLKLEIAHRRYTHNVLAALAFGLLIGYILKGTVVGFLGGFIAGFGGTLLHLLGDIFTYKPFKPLWPFLNREVALELFSSDDHLVNRALWALGVVIATLYFMFVYINILECFTP